MGSASVGTPLLEWMPADELRFAGYRIERAAHECWEWVGGHNPRGYGNFSLAGKRIGAHVFAFAITNGGARPPVVRHTCDNPPCTNPGHLIGGTTYQNAMDARIRGHRPMAKRYIPPRTPVPGKAYGRGVYTARMDEDRVRELRRIYAAGGESTRRLAQRFGVSKSQVHVIITGESWAHV